MALFGLSFAALTVVLALWPLALLTFLPPGLGSCSERWQGVCAVGWHHPAGKTSRQNPSCYSRSRGQPVNPVLPAL